MTNQYVCQASKLGGSPVKHTKPELLVTNGTEKMNCSNSEKNCSSGTVSLILENNSYQIHSPKKHMTLVIVARVKK